MLRLLAVCASLVLAGDCFAQDRPRDVSGALRAIREKQDVPALAGAVVEHGKVTALGADGVRKRGGKEAVTTGDLFHLGSDTKAMTATMLATLVEEGKLKWTTTVGEVFGDLTMDEQWKAVTLEQLLWHRGGAPTGLETGGLWGRLWKFKGAPAEARMELVKGVLKNPPHPVGKYEYSNAGYAMAGAMAERVMKKSWEELMRERVFRPLGMGSAGFGAPGDGQPLGHKADGEPVEPGPGADNPVAIGPAGIVHCSMEDWGKFVALHLKGEREGGLGLKPETFKKLHAPGEGPGEKYAMGWAVTGRGWAKGEGDKGLTWTHSGSNTMWYCTAWLAPERDFAVITACNQGGDKGAKACDEAASALIMERDGGK